MSSGSVGYGTIDRIGGSKTMHPERTTFFLVAAATRRVFSDGPTGSCSGTR
jgi:hypothetical protein